MTNAIAVQPQECIRLRGRSFMAFVLTPSLPIRQWLVQLDKWEQEFTVGRPIILDLAGAAVGVSEITQLFKDLAARGIRIMALEGADANQLGPSLPPLLQVGQHARTNFLQQERSRAHLHRRVLPHD